MRERLERPQPRWACPMTGKSPTKAGTWSPQKPAAPPTPGSSTSAERPAAAGEAALRVDLVAMGMLAHEGGPGDGLVANGQAVEGGVAGKEVGIGMAVGRHRLPIGRAVTRLHDDGPAAHAVAIHGL